METFTHSVFFFFFLLSLTSNFLGLEAFHGDCIPAKCNPGASDIRFPFHIRGSTQHCGRPGFELTCVQNDTVIHFPSYGDLVVKSISYDTKRLHLLDPKSCVHEVFLNLNLSLTPFVYYYVLRSYTYLNCSSRLVSFTEIPCLSGSKHRVYTVDPSMAVPGSCRAIKTVDIPFGYSPYLSDNSFGLGLTWGSLGRQDCESKGIKCALRSPTTGPHVEALPWVSMKWVFAAVTSMISLKIYWTRKTGCQKEGEEHDQVGEEITMGDYYEAV